MSPKVDRLEQLNLIMTLSGAHPNQGLKLVELGDSVLPGGYSLVAIFQLVQKGATFGPTALMITALGVNSPEGFQGRILVQPHDVEGLDWEAEAETLNELFQFVDGLATRLEAIFRERGYLTKDGWDGWLKWVEDITTLGNTHIPQLVGDLVFSLNHSPQSGDLATTSAGESVGDLATTSAGESVGD